MAKPWHMSFDATLALVRAELHAAERLFPCFNSAHEGYAVIREELDELWDAIKRDDVQGARREAVQVAAMALRFLRDVDPDGKRGNA